MTIAGDTGQGLRVLAIKQVQVQYTVATEWKAKTDSCKWFSPDLDMSIYMHTK